MARRALEIFRAKLGEAHPHTESARNALAAIEREAAALPSSDAASFLAAAKQRLKALLLGR